MDNTAGRCRARSCAEAEAVGGTQMTHPKIRHIPFRFDEHTPFQWNPANPLFGFAMNTLSFIAPPFERYIVSAVHLAMPRIEESEMRAEAEAFLRQAAVPRRSAPALAARALAGSGAGLGVDLWRGRLTIPPAAHLRASTALGTGFGCLCAFRNRR